MDRYDKIDNYCRMLGHYLPFKYCRTLNKGLPCAKILDCHFENIPIQEFMEKQYTEAEKEKIFMPQPTKLSSIIDLVQKAKQRK